MAERKLSEEKRKRLRDEIRILLERGSNPSNVRKIISAKYKVAEETVRYYMKTNGDTKPKKKKAQRSRSPVAAHSAAASNPIAPNSDKLHCDVEYADVIVQMKNGDRRVATISYHDEKTLEVRVRKALMVEFE